MSRSGTAIEKESEKLRRELDKILDSRHFDLIICDAVHVMHLSEDGLTDTEIAVAMKTSQRYVAMLHRAIQVHCITVLG